LASGGERTNQAGLGRVHSDWAAHPTANDREMNSHRLNGYLSRAFKVHHLALPIEDSAGFHIESHERVLAVASSEWEAVVCVRQVI